MNKQPFINSKGVIEVAFSEGDDVVRQAEIQEAIERCALELEDEGKPVKVLSDLSGLTDMGKHVQGLTTRGIADINFYKSAAYGASKRIQEINQEIFEQVHKPNIRSFDTREEAEAWLDE